MFLFTVACGFTTHRPIRPDERTHTLQFMASTDSEAHLIAAQWIASRPGVEMPTSTEIISVEM